MIKNKLLKLIFTNILLVIIPAYIIRFSIWFITLNIDTGSNAPWKTSYYLKFCKLFIPDIFVQDGIGTAILITLFITIISWLVCIILSILLSYLSYEYHYLKLPINSILWFSNFHLFFGFLLLYSIWGEEITPDWFWASCIVILFNGSLQNMTKVFYEQIKYVFSEKYVLFNVSQGIDKWRSAKGELIEKVIYLSLEFLPFFLLSTIIIELVFERLMGLGSLLLINIKDDIMDNDISFDRVDEIFIIVVFMLIIVRIAKLFSSWMEVRMKSS